MQSNTKGKSPASPASPASPPVSQQPPPPSFPQRLAESATSLTRSALTTTFQDASSALAAQLQASEKSSISINGSFASASSSSHSGPYEKTTALRSALGESFRSNTFTDLTFDSGSSHPPNDFLDDWHDEQQTLTPVPTHDVDKGSNKGAFDGADVAALLSDPTLLEQIEAAPSPPPLSTQRPLDDALAQKVEASLRASLPSPPIHQTPSADNDINLLPDRSVVDPVYLSTDEDYVTAWLRAWRDVLERYTEDVWDPSSRPWITEARAELKRLDSTSPPKSEGGQGEDERSRAVRRLRALLGHVGAPEEVVRSVEGSPVMTGKYKRKNSVMSPDSPLASWDSGWVGEMRMNRTSSQS